MKIYDLDKRYVTESRPNTTSEIPEGFMDDALGAAGRRFSSAKNKALSKVSSTAKGKVKHDVVVDSMFQTYKEWLGSMRGTETIATITKFLQEIVGFDVSDIKAAMNAINEEDMGPVQEKPVNRTKIFKILSSVLTAAIQSGRVPAMLAKSLPVSPAVQQKPKAGTQIKFSQNQQVQFISSAGKTISAVVLGKSTDGDDLKVAVKSSGKQNFNVSREKLLDPKTKKPFKPGQQTY